MTVAAENLERARRDVRFWKLTPRWTELKPHPGQSSFFWHPAPIKINPSGRRSGKTELAKRMGVKELVRRRAWPTRIFFGAPTQDQARQIFWDDLKALIPEHWKAETNESRMTIVTRWGAMLKVAGLDRPQRLEGVPWDWGNVDEIADCPARCFNRNIMPALSTLGRQVRAVLTGVPDEVGRNQAEYEELWELGLQWPRDPDVCSFHWRSSDILEPGKLAALKSRMDPLEYEQEYGGRFITSGGRAVPRFDRSYHVNEWYAEYTPILALDWTLDFGVNPAASLLCQNFKNRVWVMDEIVIPDGSTEAQEESFRKRVAQRGYSSRAIRLFGDAAGNQRHSPIGVTDYDVLQARTRDLNIQWEQLESAPLVKDSLNAVRRVVCTADDHVHLHVHPRCVKLIEEMRNAPWPDKHQLRGFHCLAALRYYCWRLFGEGLGGVSSTALHLPNLGGGGQVRRN